MEETSERHPLWDLVYAIEQDVRGMSAKLQELRMALAAANLPMPTDLNCPICGLKTKGPHTLAEHLYYSHDAEVPETWERVDKLVG